MAGLDVVILASFLLAFKAILIEGSEVAILSLATIKQIGRRNVFLGVALGGLGSIFTFIIVEQAFLALKTISDQPDTGNCHTLLFLPVSARIRQVLFSRQIVQSEDGKMERGSRRKGS